MSTCRCRTCSKPLVPTVVHLLNESLLAEDKTGCGRLVYLLRVLPLINREARDQWRKERNQVQVLLTYCDYLHPHPRCHRRRYLDGVIPIDEEDGWLWTEPASPDQAPEKARAVIALPDIFKSRQAMANKCDAIRSECGPEDAPLAARFVATITRTHLEFRMHPAYKRHFTVCQRIGCERPALVVPPPPECDEEASSAARVLEVLPRRAGAAAARVAAERHELLLPRLLQDDQRRVQAAGQV